MIKRFSLKRAVLFTACCGLQLIAQAQLETKGWWTRDLFSYRYYDVPGAGPRDLDRTIERFFTQPEIGYALGKRWLVGIVAQYESSRDHYRVPADTAAFIGTSKRFYGAGPLVRYYYPLGKRVVLMPEFFTFFSREFHTSKYAEFGTVKETRRSLDIFGVGAFPSLVCFLTRDLALSLTVASVNYYSSREGRSFTMEINPQQWLLGVEYYFEKRGRTGDQE